MLKTLTTVLSTVMLVQASYLPQAVQASPVTYTPSIGHSGGFLDGTAKLSQVDSMKLKDANAKFHGNTFEVKANDQEKPLLYGVLMDPKLDISGKHAKYTAVAYLQGGESLNQVANTTELETVILKDNSAVNGNIKDIDTQGLLLATAEGEKRFDLKDVASVDSPRIKDITVKTTSDSFIEPGKTFIADGTVEMQGCPVKRRSYRQVRQPEMVTTTETKTETKCSENPVCPEPAAVIQPERRQIVQPVVVQRQPCLPAVVRHRRNLWPLALLAAAGIATAITLPIVLSNRGHRPVATPLPVYFDGFAFR